MERAKKITNLFSIILISAKLFAGSISSNEKFYLQVSQELLKSAKENNITTIAVIPFKNRNSVPQEEIEYFQEKLTEYLHKDKNLSIIDIELSKRLGQNLTAECLISGSVFITEDGMKIIMKMIRVKDGKTLAIVSGLMNSEHLLPKNPFESDFSFLSDFNSALNSSDFLNISFSSEFRDAVADIPDENCEKTIEELKKLQEENINLKAKYWAYRIRQPDFSYASLTSNPGSEIINPSLKQKFYELLKEYYKMEKLYLPSAERQYIENALKREKELMEKCRNKAI